MKKFCKIFITLYFLTCSILCFASNENFKSTQECVTVMKEYIEKARTLVNAQSKMQDKIGFIHMQVFFMNRSDAVHRVSDCMGGTCYFVALFNCGVVEDANSVWTMHYAPLVSKAISAIDKKQYDPSLPGTLGVQCTYPEGSKLDPKNCTFEI